ncbi:hypothetical protein RB213_008347 [Colletotrichum asianum]
MTWLNTSKTISSPFICIIRPSLAFLLRSSLEACFRTCLEMTCLDSVLAVHNPKSKNSEVSRDKYPVRWSSDGPAASFLLVDSRFSCLLRETKRTTQAQGVELMGAIAISQIVSLISAGRFRNEWKVVAIFDKRTSFVRVC